MATATRKRLGKPAPKKKTLRQRYLREYQVWQDLKQRCLNPKNPYYNDYGGRGITVCPRWLNSFENFIADMGQRPSRTYSIERRDNNKGYNPKNCYWATQSEQCRNTRQNRNITFNGKTQCIQAWADETKMPFYLILHRLQLGWPTKRILTQPATNAIKTDNRKITFGEVTKTLAAWERHTGIKRETIASRLNRGWPIEKVLGTQSKSQERLITFRGKTQSITEWAQQLNLNRITISTRLFRGWSIEKTLTTPLKS